MNRRAILKLFQRDVLRTAAERYGVRPGALSLTADYEGCQNLVYAYEREGRSFILRVSYRADRSPAEIAAELHFVNYLGDHGVGVSRPVPSMDGNLLELIDAGGVLFKMVAFVKGKGSRVPDNGYRYLEGVPIEVYFRDWGENLGRLHRLSRAYVPPDGVVMRPHWFELERFRFIDVRIPATLPWLREKLHGLVDEVRALPRPADGYGLIHGDFNDGNFTLDYDTGAFTLFDFDDCCYGHFMYELACAWQSGVGRTMFAPLAERRAFMERYFRQVLAGYERQNQLNDAWMARLPLFLKLIELEEVLYYIRYWGEADAEMQGILDYRLKCVAEDIPFFGFFNEVYDRERPFSIL